MAPSVLLPLILLAAPCALAARLTPEESSLGSSLSTERTWQKPTGPYRNTKPLIGVLTQPCVSSGLCAALCGDLPVLSSDVRLLSPA